jgi:ABC-2 type transport system permease protein
MTGTLTLIRHFLRRDRWMLLWWTLGATLLYYSQAVSVDGIYTTQAEFDRAADMMAGNSAFVAMAGPARALNTIGGQVTWQSTAFGAVVAGLMSMFVVARHTRAEEESGHDELLRASAVGRFAPMTAALAVAALANLLLGTCVALSLISYPLAVPDSIALGLGLCLVGLVFTGTALVAAQTTSSTRGMYGVAGAVLAAAYALRALGDVGNPVLSWLSPIGWYQAMHAFSGVRWWPTVLLAGAAALMAAAAYSLFVRRDYGAGMLAGRPGPVEAGRSLRSGWGLAWRLQRGSVIGWGIGMLALGVAYGSLGTDVGDLVGDSEASREMLVQSSGDVVDGFYATAVLMLALGVAAFAISSALRPRGEEDDGRVEVLLAAGLSRRRWLTGHLLATLVGVLALLVAGGLGLGAGFTAATGDGGAVGTYTTAMLGYAAPVLVLSGVARALYGVVPRAAALSWLGLALSVVVLLFGELLRLPRWVQDLSPFEHLALVPAEPFRWLPFLALLLVAAGLSAVGQLGLTRRDLR